MRSGLYDNSKKEVVTSQILFLLVAGIFCFYYWQYIDICGYRVPIMDFFKWIRMFGEKVHDGGITFIDFFYDLNEQMQPGAMAIIFAMLEKSNYSMWPMMIVGAVLQCVKAVLLGEILLVSFLKQKRNLVTGLLCSISVVALGLNLNQWELLSEPFEMTNAIRVMAFYGIFLIASYCFSHLFQWRFSKQLLAIFSLSIISVFVAITVSGAYFAAMFGAVSIVGCLLIFEQRRNIGVKHILHAIIWAVAVIVTFVIYFFWSATSVSASVKGGISAIELIQGFIIYWGAALVPQKMAEETLVWFYFAGIVSIIVSVVVTTLYLKNKKHKQNYFPIMLFLYGALSGIVIVIGRVPALGVGTMTSSRYCVESVIGIIGVIFMIAQLGSDVEGKISRKVVANALSIFIIIAMTACFVSEMKIAPYRAEYQKGIIEVMINIDDYSDEQLAICQARPEDVRATVRFFRENRLSIFSNCEEKIYEYIDCVGLVGS